MLVLFPFFETPPESSGQSSSLSGRPVVIFIHGRDQMLQTGAELEFRWFGGFEDGLEALSPDAQSERRYRTLIPATDRKFVRYERVYEPGFSASPQCGGKSPNRGAAIGGAEFERTVMFERLDASLGSTEPSGAPGEVKKAVSTASRDLSVLKNSSAMIFEAQRKGLDPNTASSANWISQILHTIRNAATKMFGVGPGLSFTEDTRLYLQKGEHHCETNLRLQLALQEATSLSRPIVLVAHSMGAMVALDELWRSSGMKHQITRFVSLGAQLGVPDLLRYLAGAGATQPLLPAALRDWVNIKGQNDLLGFDVNPSSVKFASGGSVENTSVDTGSVPEAHSVSRYLQLRITAQWIADAYCRAFTRGITASADCKDVSRISTPAK